MKVVTPSGETIALGTTEASPTIGIIDYSRRVTDDFGVTTVVERGFARRMSVRLAVPFDRVDAVQQQLADLRATPVTWIADDRFASLSVRGIYKDFEIDHAVPPLSYCTLTVEGLVEIEPPADAGGDPAPAGQPSTLQLLQPAEVTDAALISSTIAEEDYAEWTATVSYPIGARVILASTHRVYESAAGANIGNDPAGVSGKWIDLAPTNRWAMFDQALGSASTAADTISVKLDMAGVDAVALLDVVGSSVRLQAAGYDRTIGVNAGAITVLDLPSPIAGPLRVTITGPGTVSVGTLLVGRVVALGITEASPTAGITDFSRKEVDDFGEVTIVQRAFAKRMSAKALIRTDAVDAVAARVAAVRARPSLWIGRSGMDSLTVYGFFKDFSIEVGQATSKLSLSIEGLSAAAKLGPLVNWPDIGDPDGTKPAPGADKTGDNTAKDTAAVGGRPAPVLLDDISINAVSIIAQALRQDDLAAITDARTFVGGQSVATYVLQFRNEQTTFNSAINSTLELLGARTADGIGWVLNMATIQIGGGKTLAQKFDEIGASNGALTVSVQQLMEAVINPDGSGFAKFILRANANGSIVGITGTADGTEGRLSFAADEFEFVDPNGGNPVSVLGYSDGRWTIDADVYVRSIVDGAVSTESLANAAVQQTQYDPVRTDVSIARGATVTVASVTFTKHKHASLLKLNFFGMFWSADDLQFSAAFVVDGSTSYGAGSVNIVLDTQQSQGRMPITPFYYLEGLPAGQHTISFSVYNAETDNIPLIIKAGSALEVLELKQGAV